jgi:hypothetical protein
MEWKTKGMEDNEMEWKTRPMLGAQRIYLQHDANLKVPALNRRPPLSLHTISIPSPVVVYHA